MVQRRSGQPTIFVVDDERSMRVALARILRSAGYEVEPLRDCATYLERPAPSRPACLVLDIRMPVMNGLDLQEMIQGTPHALPIVFVTGVDDKSTRRRAEGAVDLLLKPISRERLLCAVERALDLSAASIT
jgi:two-component system response regulator FixJ